MTAIERAIAIAAPPERVFAAYVEQINAWWPRQGLFRYTFAPASTAPAEIHFEPVPGGRLYERFAQARVHHADSLAESLLKAFEQLRGQ